MPSTSKRSGLAATFSASCTLTARPSCTATMPQHSLGKSRLACATMRSSSSGAISISPRGYRPAAARYSVLIAGRSSSSLRESPASDSLNSRMPFPRDLPTSGSFFGPSTIRAMARMTMSSIGPTLGMRSPGRSGERCGPDATPRREAAAPRRSPPDRGVEVLDLLDALGVDAARQVLPAVVADDEDDVALVELARDPHRDRGDRPRRDAREQALVVEQPARPDDGVAVGDEDLPVEEAEVDDRRDEAVVERAQA